MTEASTVRTGTSVAAAAATISRVRRSSSAGQGAAISRGPSGCWIVAGCGPAARLSPGRLELVTGLRLGLAST